LWAARKRTFSFTSSTTCSIPSIAQAYSFQHHNFAPQVLVDFVTVSPTPLSLPQTFSTLIGLRQHRDCQRGYRSGGTGGSVDVVCEPETRTSLSTSSGFYMLTQ
jgi:hypothetical protein